MTTSDEMGNFCHDHYEHPLLWCEEKKRVMERKNAEESMRMWRRRKAEEVARKDKEKQEYYDLFIKHCPWGRPGGGAPNVDVRRKDITAIGLHSTPTIVQGAAHRLTSLPPCRYSDYFSKHKKCHDPVAAYQHHHRHHHNLHIPHAPTHAHTVHHISESAHPVAGSTVTICERPGGDASASKPGKNGHVDIELRYKPTAPGKGKPLLEKITVTENDKCSQTVIRAPSPQIKKPPKKPPCKDPWGKPGPGGKPWRSPKAVGSSFMKSLGWTNKQMLKDLDQDNPATPAEKPTFRKTRPSRKPQRCCDLCTCTCPAVMLTSALKPLPKKVQPCLPSKGAHCTTKIDIIKPKACPRFVRHCAGPPSGIHNQATTTDNSSNNIPGGGVELVPLLARRRANNRPLSLSSTDVTKRTASHDRISTAADMIYLQDLNRQISDKRRSISVTQQLDRDLCTRHFETFDTFWGRPGHGAPCEIKTKSKLDNLLYGD